MHIKRRLQINSLGIVLLALAIVSVLTITLVRVNRALQSSKIASAIFVSSYERLMLRTDSYRTGSERTRVQLTAKHKEIGDLLTAADKSFASAHDQRIIHELLNKHESIGLLSKTIRERRAKLGPPADPLSKEADDLLLSQLNANVYESMLLQGKLLQSSQNAVDSSLRMAATAILLVLMLVASLVLFNSFTINRIFASRIRVLRRGATQIGAGDLDHRIPVEGDDELGELAGTFNEMACQLSRSYRDLQGEIEERKRVEYALRESEERLRLLGDNLPDSAVYQYLLDSDGGMRFLYFSAGVERLNGISAAEVLQDATVLLRQVLPEYRDRLVEAEAVSARDLTDFDMVLPMRRPDGRLRWMHLHSRPRRLPNGTVLWDGVQTDVTERIEAEEKLARQNAMVQGINRIFEAALSYEDDQRFGETCLAVAEEITGSRFGFIGAIGDDGLLHDFALSDPGWDLCRVDVSSGERRPPGNFHIHGIYGAVLTGGKGLFTNAPAGHPAAIGLPEGHPPLTSFLGVPLISAGRVTGMIAVANREGGFREQDLASLEALAPALSEALQRREAERALREREVSFRMLIENNPNIIGRFDRQHRCLYLSPSAQSITGVPPESSLGKSGLEMGLPPELCARWEGAQDRAFEGELVTARNEMVDPAGRRRVLLETFVPERSPDGSIPTVMTIAQEITELIEAQEEKEVLLKEIHHRVKNNMQVISSLVSLQAGASGDPAVREILDEVSCRVRSMALVHEKLYRSADLAHIDFADYLDSLLSYIWRAHGSVAESVRLTLDLEPVSLPVDTAVPCGLIVNELASNALKHAFAGREEGEVKVSLKQDGGGIRLAVADNGVGLPEGMDWRRANSLGLRLVQMLAGQLDAEVAVSSGRGTVFELVIDTPKQAGGGTQQQ